MVGYIKMGVFVGLGAAITIAALVLASYLAQA
jgi:hypothetical protein